MFLIYNIGANEAERSSCNLFSIIFDLCKFKRRRNLRKYCFCFFKCGLNYHIRNWSCKSLFQFVRSMKQPVRHSSTNLIVISNPTAWIANIKLLRGVRNLTNFITHSRIKRSGFSLQTVNTIKATLKKKKTANRWFPFKHSICYILLYSQFFLPSILLWTIKTKQSDKE